MRPRAAAAALICAALLVPPSSAGAAAGRHRPVPVYPGAGFAHAMHDPRTAVTVDAPAGASYDEGLAYLNAVAGWLLLARASPGEITVDDQSTDGALWGSLPPYSTCHIGLPASRMADPGAWTLMAHELMHCLGWDDGLDVRGYGVNHGYRHHYAWDRRELVGAGYGVP